MRFLQILQILTSHPLVLLVLLLVLALGIICVVYLLMIRQLMKKEAQGTLTTLRDNRSWHMPWT